MTFRTRLMLVFTVAVAAAVGVVELLVTSRTREAFERAENQRVTAAVAQVETEYARRKQEIVRTMDAIARSERAVDIAIAPDYGRFVDEAPALAAAHGLDLLELVAEDGAIISSAQWRARFSFHEDWLAAPVDWKVRGAFLKPEELPNGFALALVAVSQTRAGDRTLYVAGGLLLDRQFLSTLAMPEGMRVLLYRNLEPQFSPAEMIDAAGPVPGAQRLRPFIEQVRNTRRAAVGRLGSGVEAETLHALPLWGSADNL